MVDARQAAIEELMAQLPHCAPEKRPGIRKKIALLRAGKAVSGDDGTPPVSEADEPDIAEILPDGERLVRLFDAMMAAEDQADLVKERKRDLRSYVKAVGFDVPVFTAIVRRARADQAELARRDIMVACYAEAVAKAKGIAISPGPGAVSGLLADPGRPPERKAPPLKVRHASDAVALAQISRMNRGA